MRIAFLGLGLIGGSIALALRGAAARDTGVDRDLGIIAWSPGGRGPRQAASAGVVDRAAESLDEAIADAEIVVLAAPPIDCLALIDRLAGARSALPAGATVTDVASTKGAILARADAAGLRFVGGHPMAGRETSGYGAASAALFAGRPWVVVSGASARPEDVTRVEWLATACGAHVVRLGPDEHDAATAAVSHVPLIVSAALAGALAGKDSSAIGVEWAVARELAATGWRDSTRLARGDPAMGAGIAMTNRAAIARGLRLVREEIDAWLVDLESGREDAVPPPARDGLEGSADTAMATRLAERLRVVRRRLDS